MIRFLTFSFAATIIFSCGNEANNKTLNSEGNPYDLETNLERIELIKESLRNSETQDSINRINEKILDTIIKDQDAIEPIKIKTNTKTNKTKSTSIKDVKEAPPVIPIIIETKKEEITEPIPVVKAEIHKTWDDLLKKHVSSSGKVNYAGFLNDKDELLKYIKELQSFYKDVESWNKNKRLAYWINVYNAVTVKLIADNYPVKSITDLKGGKPWNAKLINLGGVSYSLDVIENKIIRPKYNEPRIHFAVNCAAKSCPKIMNKAWTEDNIQRYLTKLTKAFVANTTENNISADKVELSKIFEWYKVDFGGSDAKLIEFINKYSDVKVNDNATISFKEYNWNLNN